MVDILILGATGFTGRLITRYLYNHPQRSSFTLAVGARSKAKLDALKASLRLDDSVLLVQVDVTRRAEVEDAVRQAHVVINAVGPYWRWGTSVVRACAHFGKHYVDLTGEPPFIQRIINKYDYLATKTGALIVPSCGFDCIPPDILVFLANRTLKSSLGPTAQLGLSQTFYDAPLGMSGGSASTIVAMFEEVPRARIEDSRRDYALSPSSGAPSPRPRLVYTIPFSSPTQFAGFWPLVAVNRAIVQRTFGLHEFAALNCHARYGELRAAEKEAEARLLTYGPNFTYEEGTVLRIPGQVPAVLYSIVAMVVGVLLSTFAPVGGARWLFKKLASQPGEGPSDETMQKGYLEATNYTWSASEDDKPKTVVKTVMHGRGDPGYLLSAVMISECALALLLDKASLPTFAQGGGVLTPASAFGEVLVKRLEASGRMHFESAVVQDGQTEGRKAR
ncbi:hypothetical protein A0H81_10198 [Grifola frondosa]|uniref:Saccharopine dehydrogenase NADP binding domain-containing protein n=1 Tax=Grifola frondosa TaxID=5627 RepID=A0A1C7LY59_GRIFR|nr:hypothetical protein A0H81_10198 [Grifola frondosa]